MDCIRMNGAGNSFFVLEDPEGELRRQGLGSLARQLCRPEEGEQTDGMIVLVSENGDEDFRMLFYNADGSPGEMCGNGARCAARYGVEHGLVRDPENIRFRATAGVILARRLTEELYEVRLNDPSTVDLYRRAPAGDAEIACSYVELGNPGIPHAVTTATAEDFADLDALRERGRALRYSSAFPKGANVSFVRITGQDSVQAITFERGVEDFTLACGTGAGATAVSLILKGEIPGNTLRVEMPGGTLGIRLTREGDRVRDIWLTGPTETS